VVQADETGAEAALFAPAAFQDADARQPRGARDEPPGELGRVSPSLSPLLPSVRAAMRLLTRRSLHLSRHGGAMLRMDG